MAFIDDIAPIAKLVSDSTTRCRWRGMRAAVVKNSVGIGHAPMMMRSEQFE
jgi:hypothetical protein